MRTNLLLLALLLSGCSANNPDETQIPHDDEPTVIIDGFCAPRPCIHPPAPPLCTRDSPPSLCVDTAGSD